MFAIFGIFLVFIGLAIGLVWYFLSHDRGEKEPIGALWIAAGFGLIAVVIAGLLENFLLPSDLVTSQHAASAVLVPALGVGVIEEAAKFLPLALFIYPRRYFNEHTDGIIYFAIVGLGFGLPENILYTTQYGSKVGLSRILLTPFFHAATTSMVGYFSLWLVAVMLGVAMLLHGLYDFGLMSGILIFVIMSLMITVVVAVGMFLFYMRATELDQDIGLSVVGNNSFCRTCGTANPKHRLFCSHCGNHA
jgi:RsiW-degrading membrane proteinase PrsW (M82 family)